jgi:PAS domain S-box-containing protein
MRPSLRQFGVIAGFALLGLLLIANAVMTKHRMDVQSGNAQWVLHSRQVEIALEEAESTLKDAETGQRGYLLTGDSTYLAPYDRAKTEIGPRLDDLAQMTADNPSHRANINELRTLTREKMDEMAQTVSLYQSGKADEAKAVVLSDRGLLLMDKIRLVFAEMRLEETRLDGERDAEYRRSIRMTAVSIWLASLAALLGVAALAYFIVRERALREKHDAELRVSEEWFRTTLGSIGDAVIATDRSGNVTFLNEQAERLTGARLQEARGKSIGRVFPIFSEMTGAEAEDPVKKVMELGTIVGLANHTVLKRSDGALIPIEDSAAPIRDDHGALIGVVLVFRDVTGERKAQEVMRKTEKLAAAARLSATVAHEINNPLAAVVNLIFIAKSLPDTSPDVVKHLTLAEQELDRVAHITRQTLAFYRESVAPEKIDVAALVENVLKLYSNKLAAKNIKVERAFAECPPILGVSGELRQAASNLIANAIDAVEANGSITVSAHPVAGSETAQVEVVVADDGPGIPEENLDRIFEPFFTTKKDVGTGLGLWATRTIVERHGGTITVGACAVSAGTGSNGTRGAKFTIQLPGMTTSMETAVANPVD